jgi:amino acid transporter
VLGFGHLVHWHPPGGRIFGRDFVAALGGGLTVVIWNFCGWENLSVVAGEIRDAPRAYVRAVTIALPMVVLGYLLPLGVSLSGASGGENWATGWFAAEGYRMGGWMLGAALAVGGTISSFAIFEAAMLWVSRLPFVLAREGYLPAWLSDLWQENETPRRSILICCVMFTVLVPLGFTALVVLDVFFYMGALVLEMGALIRMRNVRPQRDGLFTIGGGRPALYAVAIAPLLTWLATFGLAIARGGIRYDFIIAVVLAAMVYPAYTLCRSQWGGPRYGETVFDAISAEP